MSRTLTHGPNGTPIEGLSTVTIAPAPINFAEDLRVVESGPGRVVYTDVTSPQDQPSTLRIAQQSKPNVYAGTSIDPAAFLATKQGIDTVVEIREVWSEVDSTDSTYLKLIPVRAAITLNLPVASQVTSTEVALLVNRVVAALFAQGDATIADGLTDLLHGVVEKA